MNHTFEFGLVVKVRISFTPAGVAIERGSQRHFFPWATVRGFTLTHRHVLLVEHHPPGECRQALRLDVGGSVGELRRLESFLCEHHPHLGLDEPRMSNGVFARLALALVAVIVAVPALFAAITSPDAP